MLDSVESRGSGRLPAEFLDQSQSRTRAPRPPSHQISSRLSAPWSLLQRHKLYGSPPRPYFSMKKSRQKTYLGQIGSRLSASRSHRRVTACTARRRGVPFTCVKGTKIRSRGTDSPLTNPFLSLAVLDTNLDFSGAKNPNPYCAQIRSQGSRRRICPHRLAVPEKIFALPACSIFSTAAGAPPRFIRHWRRSAPHPLPLPRSGGGAVWANSSLFNP